MKTRKYKSGSRFAFWRWTEVDSEYITRLFLVKTPWFALCVHFLNKPDPEPWLHDHPVSFWSIILRGGYSEKRFVIGKRRAWAGVKRHRWFNFVRATPDDRHSIVEVERPRGKSTVTLALMGPKTREWGFHSRDGWIGWKDYYTQQRAERAAAAKEQAA